MAIPNDSKNQTKEIIENLKKLPVEKQEYVNGYVQGVADTIAKEKTT